MRMTNGRSRTRIRRWVAIGLFTGVALLGAIMANAAKRTAGAFHAVESGINHMAIPVDSHHICGAGMHSMFGHYTVCIALETPTKGIVEYQFTEGNSVYGRVLLTTRTANGPTIVTVVFTGGTGWFEHVSGQGTGYMKCDAKQLGVQTYTLDLSGFIQTQQPPAVKAATEE